MVLVLVLLWYSKLQIVWAGKKLVSKQLEDWVDSQGLIPRSESNDKLFGGIANDSLFGGLDEKAYVDKSWSYSIAMQRLSTELGPGGGSWFITPLLNLSNTSYLEIEASCNGNPCQLEIYGKSKNSTQLWAQYEFVQSIRPTFEMRSVNIATIKKSYSRLRILSRTTKTSSTTKFNIYSMKIYSYFCENITIYNTVLGQVESSTINISKIVQCQDNGIASNGKSTNITVKCTPKGQWTPGHLNCVCDKGFDFNNHECSQCTTDRYKSTTGNERCKKCPDGRKSNAMHTMCECIEDHYILGDDEDGSCYGVPSGVQDLNIQAVTSTSLIMTWTKPMNDGGFNGSLRYGVECYHCINETNCDTMVESASFVPAKTNFSTTFVVVSNLIFNEKYKFRVISMNSLKNVPNGEWKFTEKHAVAKRPEKKAETEEKEVNSITMFFVGAGVTFVIVLYIFILIQIYRQRMKALKELTNAYARPTEIQGQSLSEPAGGQSQNNQEQIPELQYVTIIDNEEETFEVALPLTNLTDKNSQELAEPFYEEVQKKKRCLGYQGLDSMKRILDDSALYQKLKHRQRRRASV